MRMPLCKAIGVFALLTVFSLPALAGLASPVPFQATYHLSVDGWPDARISHRLSRRGEVWQSTMRAVISIAKGYERSRFRIEGETIAAESYISGYNLLGFGERYRLTADDLSILPDRQTALFALSRRAPQARCTQDRAPCTLPYLGYKGEQETLHYRVIERGETRLAVGTFPSVTVDSWDPEKPDRHLIFTVHREIPGLLLAMAYYRADERQSRLTLTHLTFPNQARSDKAPVHQKN